MDNNPFILQRCLECKGLVLRYGIFNSLWPSDDIWRQKSGSSLTEVMVCCLMATTHYLSQCWLLGVMSLNITHSKLLPHFPGASELIHIFVCIKVLTLNVRGPSYLGLTRSISWLMMPWLLTSPGHQQPWYWLYRMCRSFSYSRKDFKYMCQISVEEWHKMQIYVLLPLKNLARKGLTYCCMLYM